MMQIEKIIIYGKNNEKRELSFNLGSVSIITGTNKTGKSSVGKIIEYCLGSKDCEISAGIVRQYTNWFALLLDLGKTKCFVARKNPELNQKSCNAMFYDISTNIMIPEKVNWKSNIDNINFTDIISSRLGIEENIHYVDQNTRDSLSANIRHSLFYCFQFQYELADPRNLFHKEAENFVKQAIKDTMPYFFGVVDKKQIEIKQEIKDLKRTLLQLERKEKEKISIAGGRTRALQLLNEAQEVGLIKPSVFDKKDDISTLIKLLKELEQRDVPAIKKHSNTEDNLTEYQIDLNERYNQLELLNQKISDVKYVLKMSNEYNDEKTEQKRRLESLKLFSKLTFADNTCPFCFQKTQELYPPIEVLKKSLINLETNLNNLNANELPLRDYLNSLTVEKQSLLETIKYTEGKIKTIQDNMEDIKRYNDLSVRMGKIIGRISLWLESYREEPIDANEKEMLIKQIHEKEQLISEENITDQMESILNIISSDMTKWAKELKLEYPDSLYRFSIYNMTVFVDTEQEGAIPLRDLGSGANWIGIHLLVYFAFQKYFIKKQRPVPNFILIDQPSQIYFPNETDKTDWEAVKKIYEFIQDRVNEMEGKLQVIILDHADFPSDFNFNNATLERWDGKHNALIPYEWINKRDLPSLP